MTKTFVTLTPEEFDKFARKSPISHFQQTSAWANLKATNGWKAHFVGVKEKDALIAASLILEKPLPLGRSMFYAPRGPLLDYKNESLLKFFVQNVKTYAKKHHVIFFKVDPEIVNIERDQDGNPVKDGENNSSIVSSLKKLGFKHHGFNIEGNIAPQYTFVLNLNGRTEDELFANFDGNHRTKLRKNEKNHVAIRKMTFDELSIYKDITTHTADRRGFEDRPLSYYEEMWKALGDDLVIYLATVNLNEYIDAINAEKAGKDAEKVELEKLLEKSSHKEKIERKIANVDKDLAELEKRLKHTKNCLKSADKDGILNLGASMFVKTDREITSLFGGAYGEYREFNAAYSLNWEIIKYAAQNNYQKYNFYGISEFKDPESPTYGLYYFKRGFGGQVEEYIGEFDLVISKFWYLGYKLAYELPKSIRRRKNNRKYANSVKEK